MKLDQIARITLLVCASFLCVSLGIAILETGAHLDRTLSRLDLAIDTTQKSALLANKLINDLRLTTDNVNKAALDERHYFEQDVPTLTVKLGTSLDAVNALLGSVKTTSDRAGDAVAAASADEQRLANGVSVTLATANDTVRDLQPVEDGAAAEVLALHKATVDLDAVIADPALTQTLRNTASATGSVSASAQELHDYVHALLHPTWAQRLWSVLQGIGVDVAKIFVP